MRCSPGAWTLKQQLSLDRCMINQIGGVSHLDVHELASRPGSSRAAVSWGWGDTEVPTVQLWVCVRAVLSPSSFSCSPYIFAVSCLLCVAFPELLKHASLSTMPSFILCVVTSPGGCGLHSAFTTRGRARQVPAISPSARGYWTLGTTLAKMPS